MFRLTFTTVEIVNTAIVPKTTVRQDLCERSMMARCSCRCNRTGRCLNCVRVRGGNPCQGCLPQRLGTCANTVRAQQTEVQTSDMAPRLQNSQTSISASSTSASESPLPHEAPAPITECSEHRLIPGNQDAPGPDLLPSHLELPAYSPASEATYTWDTYDPASFSSNLMKPMKK